MLSKFFNIIKFLLQKKNNFVGIDENGNRYYESIKKKKRWVIYNTFFEPRTISPKWHIWIHYTDNVIPISNEKTTSFDDAIKIKSKQYLNIKKSKNYYKSWNPDN